MVKETTEILELIIKLFAVIGGIVTAFVFLRKWYKATVEKQAKFFTASWSNEGVIGGEVPSHYVDMTLWAAGNEVSGTFNVRKSGDDHTWHAVTISGKRYFSKAKCKIQHIKHGQVLDYGTVFLKKDDKLNLRWELKEGVADFFPKEATLYRSLPSIN